MLRPNGGVKVPMLRFMITTTPKWIGSMPAALAMGARSGVRTRMAETVSRTMPITSRRMFTARSRPHGGSARSVIQAMSAGPAPLTVRSQE
jgi:hypothetical protein